MVKQSVNRYIENDGSNCQHTLNGHRKESLMLTSLLLCICVRHFFILCHLCSTFILVFPLWTIFIISWFPTLCSGWPFSSSLVIWTDIWNSRIKKKANEMNNCGILGVVCIYSYLLITVRVLHLFHNNWSGYISYWIIGDTMYNLSHTKVLRLNQKIILITSRYLRNWTAQCDNSTSQTD